MTTAAASTTSTGTPSVAPLPDGPPPVPKNPLALLRYVRALRRDQVGFVRGRFEQYGDMYYAPFESVDLYVTRHPDHIYEVLVAQAGNFEKTTKGRAATQLRRFLGDGLLNSNGEIWRRQRRMIQPAFGRRRLDAYAATMTRLAAEATDGWRSGQELDVSREMMMLTLRIVSKTLFDHDVRDDSDIVAETMDAFRAAATTGTILPEWWPFGAARRARRAEQDMNRLVYRLIDERRRNPGGDDLLSALCEAVDTEGDGSGMSLEQLRDEIVTLFLAGHETTSHALTWTLYLVSQYPEVEERLFDELDGLLGTGSSARLPTLADLPELSFTEQVLKESMRLYPPAYVVSRTAREACEVGGYRIVAGAEVLAFIFHAHHDARWFPEPERFDPDRFTPEHEAELPRCAYLPFGAGTRTCIGKRFAMMEAQLILATLLSRYAFRCVDGFKPIRDFRVTLAPSTGMLMQPRAR